ncbi:MAG: response regulator transcription factor, partial [Acidimicrobiales bacterium]
VVEDDEQLCSVLRRHLVEEGFAVRVASDGEHALKELLGSEGMGSSRSFAAVVLDLLLPGMSGRELCNRLRRAGYGVPVVMITALGEIEDLLQCFEVGADDYLVKPFSLAELVARLRAVLRRGPTAGQSLLEVGDLRLDLLSHRGWRGETELELAPREFEVLELFMRRAGLVLTRKNILSAVWGSDHRVSENSVDQYVVHLRRRIDWPFGRSDIETVPRVGYRLRAPR